MKTLTTILSAILLAFAPTVASALSCTAVTTTTEDQHFSSYDDPNIPNCVMFPKESYPNGVCERVLQWTNYGSSTTTGCNNV